MIFSPNDLREIPFFAHLESPDSLNDQGEAAAGVRRYAVRISGGDRVILTACLILREEILLWDSCRELIGHALEMAEAAARGSFHFRLVSIALDGDGMDFRPRNFSELIARHASKIEPGQERLIRYGRIFGTLKKAFSSDRGRFIFNHGMTVWSEGPEKLDLLVKKLLLAGASGQEPFDGIIHYAGRAGFYEPHNEIQARRLCATLARQKDKIAGRAGRILLCQRNLFYDLLAPGIGSGAV